MKRGLWSVLLLLFCPFASWAQQADSSRRSSNFSVAERGDDFSVHKAIDDHAARNGKGRQQPRSFTTLATGMNVRSPNGELAAADPAIQKHANGAAALNAKHKVTFLPNIADKDGAIDLVAPDGGRFLSRPLCISYYDTRSGKSVLIAEIKDAIGSFVPGDTHVRYADCFTDFKCDLIYENRLAGMEQNLLIREQPPAPSDFGLNNGTTKLQLLTEFFNPPKPVHVKRQRKGREYDFALKFAEMTIVPGKAFLTEQNQAQTDSTPVDKHWQKLEGRDFLIEEVDYSAISAALSHLPVVKHAAVLKENKREARNERVLPRVASNKSRTDDQMQIARNESDYAGFVVDYSIVTSSADFVFKADTTYYVTNTVYLTGTTVFEGGTVIKFATNSAASLSVEAVDCRTASYRPAIFTARDDDSVGEVLPSSTGMPTGVYGGDALQITDEGVRLNNMRFSSLSNAIYCSYGSGDYYFTDMQFVGCTHPIKSGAGGYFVRNGLIYNCETGVYGGADILRFENCTVHNANMLADDYAAYGSSVELINSLLVAVTNWGTYAVVTTNSTTRVHDATGVFQTVGAAAHYLAESSVFRDSGTTNINSDLSRALRKKTTVPPLFLNNTISSTTVLSPTVTRDTDTPDVGYHYDPLDYVVSATTVSSGTAVSLTNGVVLGFYGANGGFSLGSSPFISVGSPTNLNVFASFNTVQEQANTNWIERINYGFFADTGGPHDITCRFTEFSIMASDYCALPFTSNGFNGTLRFNDCQFRGGDRLSFASTSGSGLSVYLTNCLFERTPLWFYTSAGTNVTVTAFNNSFIGGDVEFAQPSLDYTFKDNLFDRTSLTVASAAIVNNDYNGFVTNENRFTNGGAHDVILTTSPVYETGALGRFYLPSNSPLIDAGSTNASLLTLYHFTTQTNQLKETNSVVDIGFHYAALDSNGAASDSDSDGLPDYIEDSNGDGTANGGESPWNDPRPQISIVTPVNGALFVTSPCNITITTTNYDNGSVTNVEFYNGAALIGQSTNISGGLCSITWSNVSAGTYTLTAKATDNLGASTTSDTVVIVVNAMPTVAITSPAATDSLAIPTNVIITVTASDSDGSVTNVQFYDGATLLGQVASSPYVFAVYNASVKDYSLTAVAADNRGALSTSAVVNVSVTVPTNDLKIWLKASHGISTNASGNVTNWVDQSGNGNDVRQTNTAFQPSFANNVLNSQPVVRFGIATNYLTSTNNPLLTNDTRTIFSAGKGSANTNGGTIVTFKRSAPLFAAQWFRYPGDSKFYIYTDGIVANNNASAPDALSTVTNVFVGTHMAAGVGTGADIQGYLNGVALTVTQTPGSIASPSGSTSGFSIGAREDTLTQCWHGDLAEILVYKTNVSFVTRVAIEEYLGQKYGVSSPAILAPTNLVAVPLSATQVEMSWNNQTNTEIAIQVERKGAFDSVFSTVAVLASGKTSYIDSGLTAASTYTYRILAVYIGGYSAYSSTATATTFTAAADVPVTNAVLWLKASVGVSLDTVSRVTNWADQSGTTNAAAQSGAGARPYLISSTELGGRSTVAFYGSNYLGFLTPSFMASLSRAEVYVLIRSQLSAPASAQSHWFFADGNEAEIRYPNSSDEIYDGFGSRQVHRVGAPSQTLTNYHLYNVSTQPLEWAARVNGLLQYSTTNFTVAFPPGTAPYVPYLGVTLSGGAPATGFKGEMAEVLIFNRVLTEPERDSVGSYFGAKYGFVTAPAIPTNLVCYALASNQISLLWKSSLGNAKTTYKVERSLDSSTWAQVAAVEHGNSYIDTNSLVIGTTYYYRVKAANWGGESGFSNTNSVTVPSTGTGMPLSTLRLWLKGDAGHGAGLINSWADQSGYTNHAYENVATSRPSVTNNAVNDRTAIRFTNTVLKFINAAFLNAETEAEIFAVFKAQDATSASTRSHWHFGLNFRSEYPDATGKIGDNFGRSDGLSTLTTPSSPITNHHIYNVVARDGEWTSRINGVMQFTDAGTRPVFTNAAYLANSWSFDTPFRGEFAEVMIFNRPLTAEEGNTVERYLGNKYNIAPPASAPSTPTGLRVTGVPNNKVSVSWNRDNAAETIDVERKEAGGSYSLLQTVRSPLTNATDSTALFDRNYYYRIRANNFAGSSAYTSVSAPTVTLTNDTENFNVSIGTNADIGATVYSDDSTAIVKAELFNFTNLLSTVTATTNAFSFTVTNLSTGTYAFSIRATDAKTNSRFSGVWRLTVSPDVDADGTNDIREITIKTDPTVTNNVPGGDVTAPQILLEEPRTATPYP